MKTVNEERRYGFRSHEYGRRIGQANIPRNTLCAAGPDLSDKDGLLPYKEMLKNGLSLGIRDFVFQVNALNTEKLKEIFLKYGFHIRVYKNNIMVITTAI